MMKKAEMIKLIINTLLLLLLFLLGKVLTVALLSSPNIIVGYLLSWGIIEYMPITIFFIINASAMKKSFHNCIVQFNTSITLIMIFNSIVYSIVLCIIINIEKITFNESYLVMLLLKNTLVIALCEETAFRKIILQNTIEVTDNKFAAVAYNGVIFSLMHIFTNIGEYDIKFMAYMSCVYILIGISFSLMAMSIKSVLPIVVVHGFYNTAVTIMAEYLIIYLSILLINVFLCYKFGCKKSNERRSL